MSPAHQPWAAAWWWLCWCLRSCSRELQCWMQQMLDAEAPRPCPDAARLTALHGVARGRRRPPTAVTPACICCVAARWWTCRLQLAQCHIVPASMHICARCRCKQMDPERPISSNSATHLYLLSHSRSMEGILALLASKGLAGGAGSSASAFSRFTQPSAAPGGSAADPAAALQSVLSWAEVRNDEQAGAQLTERLALTPALCGERISLGVVRCYRKPH